MSDFPSWAAADTAPQSPPKPGDLPRARGHATTSTSSTTATTAPAGMVPPTHTLPNAVPPGSNAGYPVPAPQSSTSASSYVPSAAEASAMSQIEQLRAKLEQYNRSIAEAIGAVDAVTHATSGVSPKSGVYSTGAAATAGPPSLVARTPDVVRSLRPELSAAAVTSADKVEKDSEPVLKTWSSPTAASHPHRPDHRSDADVAPPPPPPPPLQRAASSSSRASSSSPTLQHTIHVAAPTTAAGAAAPPPEDSDTDTDGGDADGTGTRRSGNPYDHLYIRNAVRQAQDDARTASSALGFGFRPLNRASMAGGRGPGGPAARVPRLSAAAAAFAAEFEEVEEEDDLGTDDKDDDAETFFSGDAGAANVRHAHVDLRDLGRGDDGDDASGSSDTDKESGGSDGDEISTFPIHLHTATLESDDDDDVVVAAFESELRERARRSANMQSPATADADANFAELPSQDSAARAGTAANDLEPTFEMAERALHELTLAQRSTEVFRGLASIPLQPPQLPFAERLEYINMQRAAAIREHEEAARQCEYQQQRHAAACDVNNSDHNGELGELNALAAEIEAARRCFRVVADRKVQLLMKEQQLREQAAAMNALYTQLDDRRRLLNRREAELVARRARYTRRVEDLSAREQQNSEVEAALAQREAALREEERRAEHWIRILEGREQRTTEREKKLHEQRAMLLNHARTGAATQTGATLGTNAAAAAAAAAPGRAMGKENGVGDASTSAQGVRCGPTVSYHSSSSAAAAAAGMRPAAQYQQQQQQPVNLTRRHEPIDRDDDDEDNEEDYAETNNVDEVMIATEEALHAMSASENPFVVSNV